MVQPAPTTHAHAPSNPNNPFPITSLTSHSAPTHTNGTSTTLTHLIRRAASYDFAIRLSLAINSR